MDPSISPLTQSIFSNLLDAQTRLHEEAERNRSQAHKYILDIAGQVANDWLAEKQNKGQDLNNIPMENLINVIRERISLLLVQSRRKDRSNDLGLQQRFQNLEENHTLSLARITRLEEENANLMQTILQLKQELSGSTMPSNVLSRFQDIDPGNPPGIFLEWQKETHFDRHSFVIRLIGKTGISRAKEIKEAIIAEFGFKTKSSSADKVLTKLIERGFLSEYVADGGILGRPPHIVQLTDLGKTAYILLTGQQPVQSEFLLKKEHKTDAHTLLNLKAEEWLKKAGYEIIERAPSISIAGGHIFNPDIVARKEEKNIYIEVESASKKGNPNREAKWRTFYEFTGGEMYLFCENNRSQVALVTEVNSALGTNVLTSRICICNLGKINSEFLSANNHLWTSIREKTG